MLSSGAMWGSIERLARSRRGSFLAIFLVSFGLQLFFVTKLPERHVRPHTRWEMEATAVSLAERGAFADPYAVPTGPTAHLPPAMPALLGLIYWIFGMGLAAGYAAWLVRIALVAAMDAMLPWAADRLGIGRPAGLLAGMARALVVSWPGHGEAPTAIVMAVLLAAFVKRWSRELYSPGMTVLLGAAWGLAFHLQPALLPVLLGCLGFELWWRCGRQRSTHRRWRDVAIVLGSACLVCVPWAWRNSQALGDTYFIRSNFGLELRMGNHDGAAAAMEVMDRVQEHRHPRVHVQEARLLGEIGEAEYMRRARDEAWTWILQHPVEFLRLTSSRVVHFWLGPLHRPLEAAGVTTVLILALLGLRRVFRAQSIPQRAAILIPLATYPLVYYVVAYMIRYTVPLAWIPALLAAAEIWSWRPKG